MQRYSNAARPFLIVAGVALLAAVPTLLSGWVELRLGLGDRDLGRHASAAQHLQRAAQRLPWRTELWEQAGIEALAADQPEEAIPLLERSPAPSQAGLVSLAQAHLRLGDLDAARQAYEKALKLGASPEIYAGLVEIFRQQRDRPSERAALQNQLLFQPDNARAHYRLGLLLSFSNIDLALTHLELASRLDEEYRPVFESLRSALVLAELKPTEVERYITVGRALGLINEWGLARDAFQQAVDADPGSGEAWAWLGETYWQRGLKQDAIAAMQRAASLSPDSLVVRGLSGLFWQRQGDERRALEQFEAAAALEPDNPAWAVSLGQSRARLGDLVAALDDYERAAQMDPQNPTYWRLLAAFCADYNIHLEDVGLPAAQKAVDLSPDDPQNRDLLGWLLLGVGQPLTAQGILETVVEEQPEFALAHYHLALVYLQIGDRGLALHHLDLAIQYDPQGPTGALAAQVKKQQFP